MLGIDAAFRVGNRDDLVAVGSKQARNVLAGIAKALNSDAQRAFEAKLLGQMADEIVTAARGSVIATLGTAKSDGLSGDNGRLVEPYDLRIFIGHPAHDHGVRVDVRSRDVAVGP